MYFEEALKVELSSISGMTNRVFPMEAPEATNTPYIVYVSSEGIDSKTHDGYGELREVECEIDVVHSSYSDMKSLTRLVISKLKTFQGRAIGTTGPYIQNITYDVPLEIKETGINAYRAVIDITVKF